MNDDFKEELRDCYAEIEALRAEVERLITVQHDVYAAAREEYRRKIAEQAAENAALREALGWIARTSLTEPGLMVEKARAALGEGRT